MVSAKKTYTHLCNCTKGIERKQKPLLKKGQAKLKKTKKNGLTRSPPSMEKNQKDKKGLIANIQKPTIRPLIKKRSA
jgi:hypothetical protein